MASRGELDAVHYVRRGEDGNYLEDVGQCGFGCDYSHLVWKDDEHLEAAYRYCDKFKMRVEDYDSCDAFENKQKSQGFADLVSVMQSSKQKSEKEQKSNSGGMATFVILLIVCAFLGLYFFLRQGVFRRRKRQKFDATNEDRRRAA